MGTGSYAADSQLGPAEARVSLPMLPHTPIANATSGHVRSVSPSSRRRWVAVAAGEQWSRNELAAPTDLPAAGPYRPFEAFQPVTQFVAISCCAALSVIWPAQISRFKCVSSASFV
jgi:hypothetical protein